MSLTSMTAYGYGETEDGGMTFACEIRTLNSRYLEVSARVPRHLLALEVDIVNHVKAQLRRGKVDVFVDVARAGGSRDLPTLDPEAARHYLNIGRQLEKIPKVTAGASDVAPLTAADVLRFEGVLVTDRVKTRGLEAADAHRTALFAALDRALDATKDARAKEGASLGVALSELLTDLEKDRVAVAARRDDILQHLQKTYLKRLDAALALLVKAGHSGAPSVMPEERSLIEIAVLSDKADIDEELTRLATHIKEFERLMGAEDAAGRKLDFLCQEMHREVNTMSNKLVQTEVSQHTLEMKQTIERIRQQVQNIE